MNETEFIARWQTERPIYDAWGSFVNQTVLGELTSRLNPASVDEFLRIPAKPRVKLESSLIEKAFHRPGKNYADPYGDITDKVGVRYVTLLLDDIDTVAKIVEASPHWTASRDRDFEAERAERPEFFGYASVHYVVRASKDIHLDGAVIPGGTPCEVQIRTLLQHAHSELTHDTIYKPKTSASSLAKRFCARSMALIEATDEFFLKVVEEIERADQPLRLAMDILSSAYTETVGTAPDTAKLNTLILDAYADKLGDDLKERLAAFITSHAFVADRINERSESKFLFRQPAILLMYYLVENGPRETKSHWPLTPAELQPIYDDLGKRFDA